MCCGNWNQNGCGNGCGRGNGNWNGNRGRGRQGRGYCNNGNQEVIFVQGDEAEFANVSFRGNVPVYEIEEDCAYNQYNYWGNNGGCGCR